MSTKLGWIVAGRSILPTTAATNVTNLRSRHEALFQQVQEWMHIDCSGITSSKKSLSAEDQQALSILKKTTKLVDGHYEIGLLWKNHVSLPNNKWVAQKQLSSLEIKLARKPQLGSLYEASIATDIEKGYVSVVPDSEANREDAWYLPHHPVTNVNKPGKIRRVTNASSVYQGTSLNSSLLKGPDLSCNLTGLIMRFREKCVALSADIEAMFMQVSVPPSDRRFLRFLWRNEVHEYNRHIFGATDSPCAACYAVRQCAEDNKSAYADAPNLVASHIYMDDLYVSTNTLEEAENLRTVLQTVLATGGFNLTKWTSDNIEFNQSIPESDWSNSAPINPNKKVIDRVLCVKWNTIDDCYLLEPTNFQDTPKKLTQRTLLKYVSSIFDPLGMSSPIQIRVRTSLQQIWKGNQHWDRSIALADYPEQKNFFEDVANFSTVHIKRHYFEASKQPVCKELHVFNDASEKAIANVVFLRTLFSDKSVSLSFILGKARVAPIKRMTTPNLELLAATNGAKLAQFIKEEQNFSLTQLYIGQTALQFYLGSTHPRADTKFS